MIKELETLKEQQKILKLQNEAQKVEIENAFNLNKEYEILINKLKENSVDQ